jgi:catechol 2,3-dioxygenase
MPTLPTSSQPTIADRTPLRIGAFALVVRDVDTVSAFYQRIVGLEEIERRPSEVRLGIAGVTLLHLQHRSDARPEDKKTAGLFHTAFLMPTRRDLAAWYLHARVAGLKVERAADHDVNEAIYYDDPEGNGCECYADRPPAAWKWMDDGSVYIPSVPFDPDDMAREASGNGGAHDANDWRAPAGLRVGHINLRVGDEAASERFWRAGVGLDLTAREVRPNRGTMNFLSSGRYHHHVATNDFTSRGAGARDPERAGLAWFDVEAENGAMLEQVRARLTAAGARVSAIGGGAHDRVANDAGFETQDPWGTRVRFVAAG